MATQVSPGSRVPELRPALGSIAFLDDSALARMVAAGDAQAFEVLYERHRGEVFRYCSAITRHAQDAEEAFQLTMLAAYRALSAGKPPRGAVTPWLLRIAHNECMDLLRARPRVEELTDAADVSTGGVHEGVEMRDLKGLADEGKTRLGSGIVALVGVSADGKAGLVVGVTEDLTGRYDAVGLVRAGAGHLGGKGGGGRRDMAQAGGPDGAGADAALAAIAEALAAG